MKSSLGSSYRKQDLILSMLDSTTKIKATFCNELFGCPAELQISLFTAASTESFNISVPQSFGPHSPYREFWDCFSSNSLHASFLFFYVFILIFTNVLASRSSEQAFLISFTKYNVFNKEFHLNPCGNLIKCYLSINILLGP